MTLDQTLLPMHTSPLSLGQGDPHSKLMFLGATPANRKEAVLLKRLLEYYTDHRLAGTYLTHVIKHILEDGEKVTAARMKTYLPYLMDEIATVDPDVIITLGVPAARVFDKKLQMVDEHGVARLVSLPDRDRVHIPWLHPAEGLYKTSALESMTKDAARMEAEISRMGGPQIVADHHLGTEDEVVQYLMEHWCTFGFDTETTSPEQFGVFMTDQADMIGWSVSWQPYQGIYVAATDFGPGMRTILESPLWHKVVHNAKFDVKILKKLGVNLTNYDDTRLIAATLGESRTGLKTLTKQVLSRHPISFKEVTKGAEFSDLTPGEAAEYAAMDADHTLSLFPVLTQRLRSEGLEEPYRLLELPLVPALVAMEGRGLLVDGAQCFVVMAELQAGRIIAEEKSLLALADAGYTLDNFNSNDQLAAALEAMDAPLKKRSEKTNRLVVDAPALETIREWNPAIIEPLLAYRKVGKLRTYVQNFIDLQGPDGRLHCSFNQCGHYEEGGASVESATATKRLSSSGPNMQNVPNHRATLGGIHWGRKLRDCIIAPPGYTLLSADLGQEEPRIVASLAKDQTLLDGFSDGLDIYRPATMSLYPRTLSDEPDRVWKDKWEDWERFVGKTFFLAWYYGAGAGRLKQMDPALSTTDIRRGLKLLGEAHPARAGYLADTEAYLIEKGYIESLYGHRRYLPQIYSRSFKERQDALRAAANGRVQGTAADILKVALARIHKALYSMRSGLVSTIHDEVIVEAHVDEIQEVAGILNTAFDGLLPDVSLILEMYTGTKWSERELLKV